MAGEGAGGPMSMLAMGMVLSGALAAWGGWCLMFAGDGQGASQGRAKVSGWPFRNEEERRRKREKVLGKRAEKAQ